MNALRRCELLLIVGVRSANLIANTLIAERSATFLNTTPSSECLAAGEMPVQRRKLGGICLGSRCCGTLNAVTPACEADARAGKKTMVSHARRVTRLKQHKRWVPIRSGRQPHRRDHHGQHQELHVLLFRTVAGDRSTAEPSSPVRLRYIKVSAGMVDTILYEFEMRSKFFTPLEMLKQATSTNAELLRFSNSRDPYRAAPLGVVKEGA